MTKKISINNRLGECDRKFRASCRQIGVLDRKMDIVKCRYQKASRDKRTALFNSLRLQLATLEGVRQAFYLYACDKAAEKSHLNDEMRRESSRCAME